MNTNIFERIKSQKKIAIAAAIILVVLMLVVTYSLSLKKNNVKPSERSSVDTKITTERQNDSGVSKPATTLNIPYGIVYGIWSEKESVIRGIDLSKDKKFELASLPSNVKKISVISPEQLIYIDETDDKDHGTQIALLNLVSKQKTVIYKSGNGYGIDDYVISSNNKYLAVWEVKFAPNSAVLREGLSRIYTADITIPNVKHLIYDETQTGNVPIHYPRAITSKGEVFTDMFLPNTATGWAYGMGRSDFTGSKKEEIRLMENGTYGSQPFLSPDESLLVFSGYSGIYGPGTQLKNDFKQAALTPNTIEVYDLKSNARIKIMDSGKEGIYTAVGWDKFSGKIIFSAISKDKSREGLFTYDLKNKKIDKIIINGKSSEDSFFSFLPSQNILISRKDDSEISIGNLGDSYAQQDTKYSIVDTGGGFHPIKSADSFMQFVSIVPSSYLQNKAEVLGVNTVVKPIIKNSPKSLQLQTFYFKTELPEKRTNQQTKPICLELAREQCKAMGFTSNITTDPDNMDDCIMRQRKQNYKATGVDGKHICSDSPLYLYGEEGQKVLVKINTNVFSSVPLYSSDGYRVTLGSNNKIQINGKVFDKISYDYSTGIKRISYPPYGVVVSKDKVDQALLTYAFKLKLNQKETEDLVSWGKDKIKAPYAFVSFYDQETSEKMLPLSFFPMPDTYINIVFYLKPLRENPKTFIPAPTFKDVKERVGFTAVEISGIVDN